MHLIWAEILSNSEGLKNSSSSSIYLRVAILFLQTFVKFRNDRRSTAAVLSSYIFLRVSSSHLPSLPGGSSKNIFSFAMASYILHHLHSAYNAALHEGFLADLTHSFSDSIERVQLSISLPCPPPPPQTVTAVSSPSKRRKRRKKVSSSLPFTAAVHNSTLSGPPDALVQKFLEYSDHELAMLSGSHHAPTSRPLLSSPASFLPSSPLHTPVGEPPGIYTIRGLGDQVNCGGLALLAGKKGGGRLSFPSPTQGEIPRPSQQSQGQHTALPGLTPVSPFHPPTCKSLSSPASFFPSSPLYGVPPRISAIGGLGSEVNCDGVALLAGIEGGGCLSLSSPTQGEIPRPSQQSQGGEGNLPS